MISLSGYAPKDWEVPRALGLTAGLPGMKTEDPKTKKSDYHVKLEYILWFETQVGGPWRYTGDCLQPGRLMLLSFDTSLSQRNTHTHTHIPGPHLWGVEVLKQPCMYPSLFQHKASQSKVELEDHLFLISVPIASIVLTGTMLPPFLSQGHPTPLLDSRYYLSSFFQMLQSP